MKKCRLCGTPILDSWEYCIRCYQKTIAELEKEMESREGPSDPAKESREAPAGNLLKSKPTTHRVS